MEVLSHVWQFDMTTRWFDLNSLDWIKI